MPNRVIKESICYSDDLDQLTAFEETVFYRLIVRVDDNGRIDARPGFLRSMLFATKQGVTERNIKEAVAHMASVGLVRLYEVDGKPFLMFPKWHLHQRIRNSKEKYPAPQEEKPSASISPQVAASCGELRPESNPNPNPESKYILPQMGNNEFDRFWQAYPRKVAKKDALKAWSALKVDEALADAIVKGVKEWTKTQQWRQNAGQYVPYPATFLRRAQWEEIPPAAGWSKDSAQDYSQDEDEYDRMVIERARANKDALMQYGRSE